jgi:hypothetical protein
MDSLPWATRGKEEKVLGQDLLKFPDHLLRAFHKGTSRI